MSCPFMILVRIWTYGLGRYCIECHYQDGGPSVPRPRRPAVSTVSKGFAKYKASKEASAKRAAGVEDGGEADGAPSKKRARTSAARAGSSDDADSKAANGARPKRKAAENAPDYYAWNHGIAAPTVKWLQLIADPEKYGKDITDGKSSGPDTWSGYMTGLTGLSGLPVHTRFTPHKRVARLFARCRPIRPIQGLSGPVPRPTPPTHPHPPVRRRLLLPRRPAPAQELLRHRRCRASRPKRHGGRHRRRDATIVSMEPGQMGRLLRQGFGPGI